VGEPGSRPGHGPEGMSAYRGRRRLRKEEEGIRDRDRYSNTILKRIKKCR